VLSIVAALSLTCANAQNDSSGNAALTAININSRVLKGLQKKYDDLQNKISKKSAALLSNLRQKEGGLSSSLNKIDSLKAKALFTNDIQQRYQDLQTKLSNTTINLNKFPLHEYLPGIDSVQTALNFLSKNNLLSSDKIDQIQSLSSTLKNLQSKMQAANEIQNFVRAREAQLKEQLLNSGLIKQLTGINKQVYYYQQQLAEYKDLLNDKEKLKEKLLTTIRTLPAFQKFWQKYSYLSALFPVQGSDPLLSSATLQTRSGVQALLQQRLGSTVTVTNNMAATPQQFIQPGISQAQAQLTQLKNKLSQLNGSGNSDMTMPDFRPNNEKTKTFFKRLKYGINFQSEAGINYLPATTDIALTVAFKYSDTKEIGIGTSYKMGWGHGIKDIRISNEGIGFRGFVDIKSPVRSKGAFFSGLWLSGGFEFNYLNSFRNVEELQNNVDVWQKSALLGLSKRYKIGKNKEANIQVLYDFLHTLQNPPGRAFKFRVGYSL
jgi:hypothetical protein